MKPVWSAGAGFRGTLDSIVKDPDYLLKNHITCGGSKMWGRGGRKSRQFSNDLYHRDATLRAALLAPRPHQ